MAKCAIANIDDYPIDIYSIEGDFVRLNPGQILTFEAEIFLLSNPSLQPLIRDGHIFVEFLAETEPEIKKILWKSEGF